MNMFVGATIAGTAIPTQPATAEPAHQACPIPDDSVLLKLEEQFFEQYELGTAYHDEILKLSEIWQAESERLYKEALSREVQAGTYLTPQERWDLVTKIPECVEHNRLCKLQDVHFGKMEDLVKQMWAIPAQTPEGRRAKVMVALRLLPAEWREVDADYGIRETRQLLIEFVGGEPGAQLRDQFEGDAQGGV
ncbi:hypothetical protein V1292_005139 [Bradyrhizobium sp. AZCC 1719]|uniref:hypothetical protein n=1 Tax=Bradyrhizobium sp. AZCC 1719 TaxID=3117028 RepID=UPI002FF130E9